MLELEFIHKVKDELDIPELLCVSAEITNHKISSALQS